MKFAFLFFEFFIPYVVGFWIIFGGPHNGDTMGDSRINWEKFNNLIFSVWSMTLMGYFDFDGLAAVDRLMAQILCGTYFAIASVICMNLYIALLSDTFARVYAKAQANAVIQLAETVISLEGKLKKETRLKFQHYIQNECSPEEVYSRNEGNLPDDHENEFFEKVTRHIDIRIDEMKDTTKRAAPAAISGIPPASSGFGGTGSYGGGGGSDGGGGRLEAANGLMPLFEQIEDVKKDLNEIKNLIHTFLKTPQSKQESVHQPLIDQSNPTPKPPQQQQRNLYQQLTSSSPPHQPKDGYNTDSEFDYAPTAGRGRGRKRKRGGQNRVPAVGGYESDNNSVQIEMVPRYKEQRPKSLGQ